MKPTSGDISFEILRLSPGDAAVLDRIAEDVFDESVRPDRLAAYLADPGHVMLVAVSDGMVIGQCAAIVHRHPDKVTELYIDEVGVTEAFEFDRTASRLIEMQSREWLDGWAERQPAPQAAAAGS